MTRKRPVLITVSPNDQGVSAGPAIHFLELWNQVRDQRPDWRIRGLAPNWSGRSPIIRPRFPLSRRRVPNVRALRSVLFDALVAGELLFRPRGVVYLRLASFHVFTVLSLAARRHRLIIELNGLSDADHRSSGSRSMFRRLSTFSESRLIRRCDGAVCVSDSIEDFAKAGGAPRTRTVLNGVATAFFEVERAQTGDSRVTVIYVGTFTAWDGASDVMNLAQHFPHVSFLMVGDGERRREIEESAPPNAKFIGHLEYDDLSTAYSEADAGIVLYEIERHKDVTVSSLKTLEYVACGLPVFSTDVPGQEFIRRNDIGVLTNEPGGEQVLRDFELFLGQLPRFRESALRYRASSRSGFSWERTAAETVEFLRGVAPELGDAHGDADQTGTPSPAGIHDGVRTP